MDYKELIEQLRKLLPQKVDYAEMVGAEAVHYGKSYVYEDPESYIIEAAADAIETLLAERDAALRAQQTPSKLDRSRWEGCTHCDDGCCCTCKYSVIRPTRFPCRECDMGSMYDPQNYCPNCGCPLTEEAWAALERRINGGTTDNKT